MEPFNSVLVADMGRFNRVIFFLSMVGMMDFYFSNSLFALENGGIISTSPSFQKQANTQDGSLFEEAKMDRTRFWAKRADCLDWFSPWTKVSEGNPPYVKWFVNGKLNACYNCLDRHIHNDTAKKVALFWEGEEGRTRSFTYEELYREVNQFSAALKALGVQKGDKVAIYLPMIPETVVAMLSCARIGAIHTVVFSGFSAEALRDRVVDIEAKVVITADGSIRKNKRIDLKQQVDIAIRAVSSVEHVIVIENASGVDTPMLSRRDLWYRDLMEGASLYCPPEEMDAEDILFILYTSGTTGRPKGIIHTTGGYMVGAAFTTRLVFDVKPSDIYFCTADVGWITGHTYVVYGPLANGMTQLIYEGAPDVPDYGRLWQLIEKYKVTTFYTAPTAVRTFMKWGESWPLERDLSSLRLLGVVGEPINRDAWIWYYTYIGGGNCPIVDTWWQTETGSIMISPIPGLTPLKPGSATLPLPGIDVAIIRDNSLSDLMGILAITTPWPSMLRGIYKDPKRYEEVYWKKWDGKYYFTGDGAHVDEDGYFWLLGRIDDVLKVSGHRLSTVEIESALGSHSTVAESAAISITHDIKGNAVICFIVLKEGIHKGASLEEALREHVVNKIGAIARPDKIIFLYELPKTRSGKIMRRLLGDIASGRCIGDVTTLSDPSVLQEIKSRYEEEM